MPDLSSDQRHLLTAALSAAAVAGRIHRGYFQTSDLAVETKADASPVTLSDRQAEEAIREVLRAATPELGCFGEEYGQQGDERDRWVIDPLDGTKNFVAGLPFFATLIALERDGRFELGVVHAPLLGAGYEQVVAAADPAGAGLTWWAVLGRGAWAGTGTEVERASERRLQVSTEARLRRAFVVHGGLARLDQAGLWPQVTSLVRTVARTRGFGDWWGHALVAEGRCDAMFEASVALYDVAAIKVLVEEAGGVFRTRGNAPLTSSFNEAVLSANAALADPLTELLGFG